MGMTNLEKKHIFQDAVFVILLVNGCLVGCFEFNGISVCIGPSPRKREKKRGKIDEEKMSKQSPHHPGHLLQAE